MYAQPKLYVHGEKDFRPPSLTMYEIEQKFVVDRPAELAASLTAIGVTWSDPVEQDDTYFNHPSRDFAVTDEALRLRRVGDALFVTYKGPKIDAVVKTRREIELPLGAGPNAYHEWSELLAELGFRRVADVPKRRTSGVVPWQGQSVAIALDEVQGLGTYCELEVCAETDDVDSAKSLVTSLAAHLGLSRLERHSYLSLVLQAVHQ